MRAPRVIDPGCSPLLGYMSSLVFSSRTTLSRSGAVGLISIRSDDIRYLLDHHLADRDPVHRVVGEKADLPLSVHVALHRADHHQLG
ncbi:MAG: hypothetical protein ACRDTF_01285 [Pseudonocardiaceae bacterium]